MNKLLLLCIFIFAGNIYASAQITTRKVPDPNPLSEDMGQYDSTENFVGARVKQYVGQEFYVLPKPRYEQSTGYEGFTKNLNRIGGLLPHTRYKDLAGKYFLVEEILPHPDSKNYPEFRYDSKFIIKLKEKGGSQEYYFEYQSEYWSAFPFLVVGHFEKAKKMYKGWKFETAGTSWIDGSDHMTDIVTGKSLTLAGQEWTCVDFTVDETFGNPSLVLQNKDGAQILLEEVKVKSGYVKIISSDK